MVLPNPADAWNVIDKLTSQFAAPGLRVVVKDDAGSVVIMAGLIANTYSSKEQSA